LALSKKGKEVIPDHAAIQLRKEALMGPALPAKSGSIGKWSIDYKRKLNQKQRSA
jgi:hypothetical protein